jgi:hypothetical protein
MRAPAPRLVNAEERQRQLAIAEGDERVMVAWRESRRHCRGGQARHGSVVRELPSGHHRRVRVPHTEAGEASAQGREAREVRAHGVHRGAVGVGWPEHPRR